MNSENRSNQQSDDLFSNLMFGPGNRRSMENDEKIKKSKDIPANRYPEDFDRRSERGSIDDWLFGTRNREKSNINNQPSMLNDMFNNIDIEELMINVDKFISSTEELKPLFNKVSPLIRKFIK
ncbi:hypothetical protein BGM26_00455 [Bacillus sp. FJAT-29790]|uniref:hypothetical protein n=1 Tax=Bacillus sp. FJAT-29790 TaxID=1895002 RepID=UPI001C236E02|nr:hypothetical protein [Bacillus sp. FJAT-29790]MBU8877457.1 hypothetical protein [Bacillus sp. FJAT-29790]